MKELNIVQLIKKQNIEDLDPIVFVYGSENLLKKQFVDILKKKTEKEIHILWGDEISLEDLNDVFSSGSLFSKGNLGIILESDSFLDKINKKDLERFKSILERIEKGNDQVVFITNKDKIPSKEPYKTIKEKADIVVSGKLTPKAFLISLKKKIEASGKSIDEETLKYLAKKLSYNLQYAKQEVEKLLLYTEGKKEIQKDDIDKVVVPKVEENIFSFITAFFSKEKKSLQMLKNLVSTGHHPFEIQSLIFNYANKMLLIYSEKEKGKSAEEAFNEAGIKHPAQKGTFKKILSYYKKKDVIDLIKELYQLEISQKVYFEDIEKKLEEFVIKRIL